jgi:uncharacterized protein
MKDIFSRVAVIFIKSYQKIISPYSSGCCRFMPTCSNYSIEAFCEYGFFKGFIISLKRIIRCNPFGAYGYDPLKTNNKSKTKLTIKRFH